MLNLFLAFFPYITHNVTSLATVKSEIWVCFASRSLKQEMSSGVSRSSKLSSRKFHTIFFPHSKLIFFILSHHCLVTSLEAIYYTLHNFLWRYKRFYATFFTYTVVLPVSINRTLVEFPFNRDGVLSPNAFTIMLGNILQMFVDFKTRLSKFKKPLINYLNSLYLFFVSIIYCNIEV